MKDVVIKKCMNLIKKYHDYDDIKLAEIEYGLYGIYLTFSKFIIITTISILLGIFKEYILFLLLYNILRTFSFGIHATKSWICLVSSTIIFIGLPIFCKYIEINFIIKIILGSLGTIFMLKNSPADTKKRPIVNKKRRLILKSISTILAIIYTIISIIIKDNYISNSLLICLLLQNILIAPLTYRMFKQPYNNYKEFLLNHPDFIS